MKFVFLLMVLTPSLVAQTTFGAQQTLTTTADRVRSVYATDLDGDGDADVLSASAWDDKIAWYRNLGGGNFASPQTITTSADWAWTVYAEDLDGDGDADVLSASQFDNKIAWYENLGGGAFGPQVTITTNAATAVYVHATDLDGDNDADVLSASWFDNKIAWYQNLGGGAFGPQQVISTNLINAQCVRGVDLDGDGDADVISASTGDDKIAWYENLGGGTFGPQQIISISADGAVSTYAADLDGDGDNDVLSASLLDDRVAWYENGAVATPPCPIGACLDLIGSASIGNSLSLLLQSPSANAPCYVLADTQTANIPLGTVGATTYYSHLALSPALLPLADPAGIFGQSLTNPVTDASGSWAVTLSVPADPALSGMTFYGEAWVEDGSLLPAGLFWQSNLLTLTIQ